MTPKGLKINAIFALAPTDIGDDHTFAFGFENDLVVKSSSDLQHFKEITSLFPLIMGMRTFESLGNKPLPNRAAIVLSNEFKQNVDNVYFVRTLEQAYRKAAQLSNECYIIGGAGVLEKTILHDVQTAYITYFDWLVPKQSVDTTIHVDFKSKDWKYDGFKLFVDEAKVVGREDKLIIGHYFLTMERK